MMKAAWRRLAAGALPGRLTPSPPAAAAREICDAARSSACGWSEPSGWPREILHVEHVEHAVLAAFVEVSRDDVGAGRAERAAQVGEQARPVRRGDDEFGRRAARVDIGRDGDRLAGALGQRRGVARLRFGREAGPVRRLDRGQLRRRRRCGLLQAARALLRRVRRAARARLSSSVRPPRRAASVA